MDLSIVTAPKRNSYHWTATTVSWEDACAWVDSPADKKEAGGYLFGRLRETTVQHKEQPKPCGPRLHRRKDAIVSRSAITLDADSPDRDFLDKVEALPYAAFWHTTFSSSPDDPHYRLVILTDREMAPDEYIVACRAVMQQLGEHQFDPSTDQPERFMFLPAAQRAEWYESGVLSGEPAVVDDLLTDFNPDLSLLPMPTPSRNKRDPYTIDGVIGAFNTAYQDDWDTLIHEYELPYERVTEDRFQLVGALSQAGMGPIAGADGFVYSHHVNDPAYGQTCSAFDLVRLHRFGHLDEDAKPGTPVNKLPSHAAMSELAVQDNRAIATMVGATFDDELDANAWKLKLRRAPRSGKVLDHISNWDLIRDNDLAFRVLFYNELSLSPEAEGDLPWRTVTDDTRIITNNDRWEFVHHIEREYDFRPSRDYVAGKVESTALRRRRNPILDYLEKLIWDGKSRIEECLPGVIPNDYTRLVARKVLVAAVARIYQPGCKWDHTLVLVGNEGLGKTWWIERIARGYASTLGRIDDKDTLLAMQRSWIVMADESHSLKKADQEAQKEFLTRTHDMYRMPYDRETLIHPRHCVIWSTTNDETFLRRQQGNRRFLTVHCTERVDFDRMTDEYVDQLWAEAVYLYKAGESLYLDVSQSAAAVAERERFVEEDTLAGVIQEFVDTLVPDDWWSRTPEARAHWISDRDPEFDPPGTLVIDRVCSRQIWVEALGRRKGDARRADLLDITNALKKLPGWRAIDSSNRVRLPGYGPQLVFIREEGLL